MWWNFEGPVYWELVLDIHGIKVELLVAHSAMSEKYPPLVNSRRALLVDSPTHSESLSKTKSENLEGIELSPDFASSDYYIFEH